MQVYVMLTVDLNRGVSEDARNVFNESMKQQQWTKLKLTTTWRALFKEGVTVEGAINTTKADVKRAADAAGVSNYEGAAQAGYAAPTVWNQFG